MVANYEPKSDLYQPREIPTKAAHLTQGNTELSGLGDGRQVMKEDTVLFFVTHRTKNSANCSLAMVEFASRIAHNLMP